MKTPLFTLFFLLFIQVSYSQDFCDLFGLLKEGYEAEYTNYDAKDKVTGKQNMKVLSVKNENGAISSIVESTLFDKKGKVVQTMEVEFTCQNSTLHIDLRNLVNTQAFAAFTETMEIEIRSVPASYPSNMKVGDKLPDANLEMDARMNGLKIMSVEVLMTNQEITGRENIETPAGTFDCFKINSEAEVITLFKHKSKSETYFSPKVGTVKSINFDNKGKVNGYTLLTKVKY
jgi:hypothetical protein